MTGPTEKVSRLGTNVQVAIFREKYALNIGIFKFVVLRTYYPLIITTGQPLIIIIFTIGTHLQLPHHIAEENTARDRVSILTVKDSILETLLSFEIRHATFYSDMFRVNKNLVR